MKNKKTPLSDKIFFVFGLLIIFLILSDISIGISLMFTASWKAGLIVLNLGIWGAAICGQTHFAHETRKKIDMLSVLILPIIPEKKNNNEKEPLN